MLTIPANTNYADLHPKIAPGFSNLEGYVGYDVMLYILRFLYNLVFRAKKYGYNKQYLINQIEKFEKQSRLPGFLSSLPIDELLIQLEDAQFFYPIRKNEVTFPVFH